MTVNAPSGNAPDPVAPAHDRPGGSGGRGPGAAAGAVITRLALRRCRLHDLWALTASAAGPVAASAVLLPFRASWSNTNTALLLVVVVVAVAATGNRLAGALAGAGAAVWFGFFFTLPYYRLTIRSKDDVTTAVLPLVTGLAVSQLAAWERKLKVTAVTGEGYLATLHGTAALAQASRSPQAVADYVGGLLSGLLDLQAWRFEYGSLCSPPPRLESDGSIVDGQRAWDVEQAGQPAELELRVFGNGQYYGRFLMGPRPGARATVQARLVAVALAEQLGHAYSAAWVSGTDRLAWHPGGSAGLPCCACLRTDGDACVAWQEGRDQCWLSCSRLGLRPADELAAGVPAGADRRAAGPFRGAAGNRRGAGG
jgi:hypothetical protein